MKKYILAPLALLSIASFTACNNESSEETVMTDSVVNMETMPATTTTTTTTVFNADGTYTDLSTGKTVKLRRDDQTGYIVDASTSTPVEFYVDMSTQDTFYGKRADGANVNNMMIHSEDGKYKLDDTKIKWDDDEMKVKTDDTKEKMDGDDYKYKDGDTKIKKNGDNIKIKTGDTKIKADKDEVKVK